MARDDRDFDVVDEVLHEVHRVRNVAVVLESGVRRIFDLVEGGGVAPLRDPVGVRAGQDDDLVLLVVSDGGPEFAVGIWVW